MWSVRNWVKSIAAEYVADYVNNESWGFARDASSAAHRAEASKVRCNAALEQARDASAEAKQAASDAKAWAEKALEASGKAEYCKIMARLAQEKCEEAKPSPISQLIGRINEVDAALDAMRHYVDERIEQEGLVLRGWVNEQLDGIDPIEGTKLAEYIDAHEAIRQIKQNQEKPPLSLMGYVGSKAKFSEPIRKLVPDEVALQVMQVISWLFSPSEAKVDVEEAQEGKHMSQERLFGIQDISVEGFMEAVKGLNPANVYDSRTLKKAQEILKSGRLASDIAMYRENYKNGLEFDNSMRKLLTKREADRSLEEGRKRMLVYVTRLHMRRTRWHSAKGQGSRGSKKQ